MKNKILELRNLGKTYNQIAKELGISKGLISYHLNKKVKDRTFYRNNLNRKEFIKKLKIDAGGKCSKCEYNKHMEVLDFHHLIPSEKFIYKSKRISVTEMAYCTSRELVIAETKKCILLCSNCHREEHL